jgi:arginine decarboxylase-like protein
MKSSKLINISSTSQQKSQKSLKTHMISEPRRVLESPRAVHALKAVLITVNLQKIIKNKKSHQNQTHPSSPACASRGSSCSSTPSRTART